MSAISETYNCSQNVLELVDTLPNVSSQQVKWNMNISNENGKYELTVSYQTN